jgi:hypothetical protein
MASTLYGPKVGYKPIFNPAPDFVEKALLLIDFKETSLEIETFELQEGLRLIGKILEGMRLIQAQ